MILKEKLLEEECRYIFHVEIINSKWSEFLTLARKKFSEENTVPGFSKGRLPIELVDKYLSKDKLFSLASKLAIEKIYEETITKKIPEKTLAVKFWKSPPKKQIIFLDEKKFVVEFIFEVFPKIKTLDYEKLIVKTKKEELTISEEDIEKEIINLRSRSSRRSIKIPIQKNDELTADFFLYLKKDKAKLLWKKTDFVFILDDEKTKFLFDKLLSKKVSDIIEFEFLLEESYQFFFKTIGFNEVDKFLKQNVFMQIILKKVVREYHFKNDDEFIKVLNLKGVRNLQDLKDFIKKQSFSYKEKKIKDGFFISFFNNLISSSKIYLPESLISDETKRLKDNFFSFLKEKKISPQEYIKRTKLKEDKIEEQLRVDAIRFLKRVLIENEIIKRKNFVFDDNKINEELKVIAERLKTSLTEVIEKYKEMIIYENKRISLYDYLWKKHHKFV